MSTPLESTIRPAPTAPTHRVVLRYAAFQAPGFVMFGAAVWAAHLWFALPVWLAGGAVVGWVVKDAVLFPFCRSAYEPGNGRTPRDPRDAVGIATVGLAEQEGYVRIGPERWRARRAPGCPPIAPGEAVHVAELEGLTLIVEPARRDEDPCGRAPVRDAD